MPAKYTYTALGSLTTNTRVDVYGVVKFLKQPYKSRGSDYCMIVSIIDPSLQDSDKKLKCILFGKEPNRFPVGEVGDIIRLHRLSITTFRGELQGGSSPGLSWLLFTGNPGDSTDPYKSSTITYTLTDEDRKKIEELRDWAAGQQSLDRVCCTLQDIAAGLYFDLVCQVGCTCVIEEDVCLLLKVWDGTVPLNPVLEVDVRGKEEHLVEDPLLSCRTDGFLFDVCVFNNHFHKAKSVKPGNFVKFINLHAALHKNQEQDDLSALPTLELCLHHGDSFGRGVKILSEHDKDVIELQERLFRVSPDVDLGSSFSEDSRRRSLNASRRSKDDSLNSSGNSGIFKTQSKHKLTKSGQVCMGDGTNDSAEADVVQTHNVGSSSGDSGESSGSKRMKILDRPESLQRTNGREEMNSGDVNQQQINNDQWSESLNSNSSVQSSARCMLQTATVVLNHPHVHRTKISDVLMQGAPRKFKIRAQIYDYHPKANSVNDFIQLYCSSCHHIANMPEKVKRSSTEKFDLKPGSTFSGIPHYTCPKCHLSEEEMFSPPDLKYIFMMRFLLKDETGWLVASLWKEDAVTFLKDATPEEILQDGTLLQDIKDSLNQICPVDTPLDSKPWIECCVKSFSVEEGIGNQIFDTTIV